MKLSKDRKTGREQVDGREVVVEADQPLMLERLPAPARQFTATSKVEHPKKRRAAR